MALYESNLPACSTCQKVFVNIDWDRDGGGTGEIMRLPNGEPMLRPPGSPLPCAKCPKEGPHMAHIYELSDKNYKTVELYQLGKATHGACYTPRMLSDGVLRHNLVIVERIMAEYERHRSRKSMESLFPLRA